MAVCKHCGAEIEEGVEYCPNCGQKTELEYGDFFEPDESLEEEAYNIFDTPEEFDMDSLISKEIEMNTAVKREDNSTEPEPMEENDFLQDLGSLDELGGFEEIGAPEELEEIQPETGDLELAQLFGLSDSEITEEIAASPIEEVALEDNGLELPEAEETDFLALDDLFQELDAQEPEDKQAEEPLLDEGLEELLAASEASGQKKEEKKKTEKKQEKEKKSFFKTVFGNVPVDPSKQKPEPTPEQIAAKKQKEAEEKKAKADAKKLASEEKKAASKKAKEEKAREKALAKEEKKAKKLEEAKQILEDMKETRINRLGASIVFIFFIVIAIVLISGSDMFGYAVSVNNAEKSFDKALNNDVRYYTDAYNEIYGLDIKPEDQVLYDKIMTVMFVNKDLNSYNSYMVMKDYNSALHSLLQGLYRYGKYYETAIPLGVDEDMDFVRTQILKELEKTFDVSEDEAEVLRSMLEATGGSGMDVTADKEAKAVYNLTLYRIVLESGLLNNKAEVEE